MTKSDAVRAQYEEHPYPRWDRLLEGEPVIDVEREVLNAGCGTGHEVLADARCMPRSRFVAVDFSERSLQFAKQKAREYQITNVEFLRLDIHDVSSLDRQFDHIKSTGVLHHLDSPLAGLMALKSVLRPNGTIKFSVYSKVARRAVLKAIKLRQENNIPATDAGIRFLQEHIRALPEGHIVRTVIGSRDFQSIEGTRDLLFHVLEHNFTVPEVVQLVERAGLRIIQWGPSSSAVKFAAMGYSDPLDWRQWDEAECKKPSLFAGGMYSVIVTR